MSNYTITAPDIGKFADGYTPDDVNRWASAVILFNPAVTVSAVWESYDGDGHHGCSELIVRVGDGPWRAISTAWWRVLNGDDAPPAGVAVPVLGDPLPCEVFEWGGNYLYVDPTYLFGITLPPPSHRDAATLPAKGVVADTNTEWFDNEDAARSVLADRGHGAILFRVPRGPSVVVLARVLPDGDVEDAPAHSEGTVPQR